MTDDVLYKSPEQESREYVVCVCGCTHSFVQCGIIILSQMPYCN